jgi:hypothetical protein
MTTTHNANFAKMNKDGSISWHPSNIIGASESREKERWRIFFLPSGKPYYVEMLPKGNIYRRATGRVIGF